MRKEYLILAVFVLFVWAVRDKVPPQLQFWKTFTTMITVQNNSDHDLSDVTLIVWSAPHSLGALTRGSSKSITTPRLRRSEEHTSELQSRGHLVCRLLLEK